MLAIAVYTARCVIIVTSLCLPSDFEYVLWNGEIGKRLFTDPVRCTCSYIASICEVAWSID